MNQRLTFSLLLLFLIGNLFFISCRQDSPSPKPIILKIGGSTTLYEPVRQAANAFLKDNPQYQIIHEQSSSGNGLQRLAKGELQLARISKDLSPQDYELIKDSEEIFQGFQIGFDAICLVTHPQNQEKLKGLNQDQVNAIFFTGNITDWSQIHPDLKGKIHLYVRDSKVSGTSQEFNHIITGSKQSPHPFGAKVLTRTPMIYDEVAQDPLGLAYLPFVFVGPKVYAIPFGEKNLAECHEDQIRNRNYLMQRSLVVVTLGTPDSQTAPFIDFLLSEMGQKILSENHIVSIR